MEMQTLTDHEGQLFVRREDIVTVLRAMGEDYSRHIPGHIEANEYIEAAFDRQAEAVLGGAAQYFASITVAPAPAT